MATNTLHNALGLCIKLNLFKNFRLFEINKKLIAVLRNKFVVLFVIMFGTLSFAVVSAGGMEQG